MRTEKTWILMTAAEIRIELGWSEDMVRCLLKVPDALATVYGKYKCDRYRRDRVLAAAQTTAGQAAKKQWDETVRGLVPNPGWTERLGDIGGLLGISAVAVGKILKIVGYRFEGRVTERAVAALCGVHRWDGYEIHHDWQIERVVNAIQKAGENHSTSAVENTLTAGIAKQGAREQIKALKRKRAETEAASHEEAELLVSGLAIELRALRATDPGMSLFTAVEYMTSDPAIRVVLYRHCRTEGLSIRSKDSDRDDSNLSTMDSSFSKDLRLLERRAKSEGYLFQSL